MIHIGETGEFEAMIQEPRGPRPVRSWPRDKRYHRWTGTMGDGRDRETGIRGGFHDYDIIDRQRSGPTFMSISHVFGYGRDDVWTWTFAGQDFTSETAMLDAYESEAGDRMIADHITYLLGRRHS